jgi:hypothetical protein
MEPPFLACQAELSLPVRTVHSEGRRFVQTRLAEVFRALLGQYIGRRRPRTIQTRQQRQRRDDAH